MEEIKILHVPTWPELALPFAFPFLGMLEREFGQSAVQITHPSRYMYANFSQNRGDRQNLIHYSKSPKR